MQEQIDKDLKSALLAGDRAKVETLRGLKNALQYEAVASGSKDRSLTDEQIQRVLAREAKKRQEAADLYQQGGNQERANAELAEKQVIETYLPEQASEEEIRKTVEEEIAKLGSPTLADMGKVIGAVRGRLGASADGATIAGLVKERLPK
jgi:uncharacterized protein